MSWTSSGTNRKHNLHISLPVDTWSHTCTHRISKSTSTGCPTHHLRVRTQTPPTDQVWNPAPCHTPLFSIVWLTGQVLALDWFAKHGLLPTYLLNIPRLFCHPRPLCCPAPSFPSPSVWLHTQGERTGSECRLNPHGDKNTEYVEGARKRDVFQSQRSVSMVLPWRGRLAVKQSLTQWAGDSGILVMMVLAGWTLLFGSVLRWYISVSVGFDRIGW